MSGGTSVVAIGSLALAAVGTAVSYMGQQQQAEAQSQQEQYQSEVAQNNAIMASRAAAQVQQEGAQAQTEQGQEGSLLVSKERATLADNGIDANSGSALNIQNSQVKQNALDSQTIAYNAQNSANGFIAQGNNFSANAAADSLAAQNSLSAGTTGSIATILSGAGSVADKWYKFNQDGAL